MPFVLIIIATFFLSACSDSEDYVFKGNESTFAFATGIGIDNIQTKDTVIAVFDTILLNAATTEEGSLSLQKYYWDNGDNDTRQVLQLKTTYTKPGLYKPTFTFVDYFGDIFSDTLYVTVSEPPILNTERITPPKHSEGMPTGSVNFAWELKNKSKENIFYNFVLDCNEKFHIDTLLNIPYFTNSILPELENCFWSVTAQNDMGIKSNSIQGDFSTRGKDGFGKLKGKISTRFPLPALPAITLWADTNFIDSLVISDSTFEKTDIPAGKYVLAYEIPGYPDFGKSIETLTISNGQIQNSSIVFTDFIEPRFPSFFKDTIAYEQRLVLPMGNGGAPLSNNGLRVFLDNEEFPGTISGDTLYLEFPEHTNPVCKILSVRIQDAAENSVEQKVTLCPKSAWAEITQDTTVLLSGQVHLHYSEQNPYGIVLQKLLWHIESIQLDIKQAVDENGNASAYLPATLFGTGKQKITVKAFYENGLEVTSYFNLEVIE